MRKKVTFVDKVKNMNFEYDFDEERTVDAYLKQHWIVCFMISLYL